MLDRIGGEVARATTVVRYARGSQFAPHEHARGEEFLVLEGVFADEHGFYPRGCYVRNPPGSRHSPFTREGCRILVKLRQFAPTDLTPVRIESGDPHAWIEQSTSGRQLLHEFGEERVELLRLRKGDEEVCKAPRGGLERYLVQGSIVLDGRPVSAEFWLRLPPGTSIRMTAVTDCQFWQKSGHLPA